MPLNVKCSNTKEYAVGLNFIIILMIDHNNSNQVCS